MRLYNAKEMAEADRITIKEYGVPGTVLMENAGVQTVNAMEERYGDELYDEETAVLVICGKGNNGGDGFVVARHLRNRGTGRVDVLLLGTARDLKGDAALNLEILRKMGGTIHEAAGEKSFDNLFAKQRLRPLNHYHLIVDAIFGTGLSSAVRGHSVKVIQAVNECGQPVTAVDIPSGLSADTPNVLGEAIRADLTVTFAAPKYPHFLPPADRYVGDLVVVDISIPESALERAGGGPFVVTDEVAESMLPESRPMDAHKGNYGHILLLGGSMGKTGAAAMAAEAAYRSGAGLVTVATPASCVPIIASRNSELMTEPLIQDSDGTLSLDALDQAVILSRSRDVLALGPGLSSHPTTGAFVRRLFNEPSLSHLPLVIDADGLNAFVGATEEMDANRREAPVIITPHPGEMSRLLGLETADLLTDRLGTPAEFARRLGLIVVLKGYRSITFTPDGESWINLTGNPGMAAGGSGDVLTGVIAALLAQRLDPADAAILGVHLHGLAGDLAALDVGEVSLMAGDQIEYLPDAFAVCSGEDE